MASQRLFIDSQSLWRDRLHDRGLKCSQVRWGYKNNQIRVLVYAHYVHICFSVLSVTLRTSSYEGQLLHRFFVAFISLVWMCGLPSDKQWSFVGGILFVCISTLLKIPFVKLPPSLSGLLLGPPFCVPQFFSHQQELSLVPQAESAN